MLGCAFAFLVVVAAPAPNPTAAAAADAAAADAAATSTQSANAEQLHAMHVQAYELMRAEKFEKATPLLERVYRGVPVPTAQRRRALVINHAILDLVQRVNVMRAVCDLHAGAAGH